MANPTDKTSTIGIKRDEKGRFEPGQILNPIGRVKGSLNKFSQIKRAFLWVFDKLGGQEALLEWVNSSPKNQSLFYAFCVKLLIPVAKESDGSGNIVIVNRIPRPQDKAEKVDDGNTGDVRSDTDRNIPANTKAKPST